MRIKLLDPLLANQIAAGEVVERPAAAVKELVENSIDAQATQIVVEILQGGIDLIRIRDNGRGIHPDDLALAFSRHATSKIQNLDDLEKIESLGFRGEALASIAAVSRTKVTSRHVEHTTAFTLECEGTNVVQAVMPAAHPQGTTIEVRNIFYNTPARRRFLKSAKTEFIAIENILHRLALSHFDIEFSLKHNQKMIFSYPVAQTQEQYEHRIAQVMGKEFIENALFISHQLTDSTLWGWIGAPNYTRSQNDMQFFYLNKRYIRDKLLVHAVKQAYHDVLYGQRQPAYNLYLQVDPRSFDVNVHPTKHEVRFHRANQIHDFVMHTIHEAIEEPSLATTPVSSEPERKNQPKPIEIQAQMEFLSPKNTHFPYPEALADTDKKSAFTRRTPSVLTTQAPSPLYPRSDADVNYASGLTPEAPSARQEAILQVAEPSPAGYSSKPQASKLGQPLAQLHNIYILAQNQEGLVIIDMHAAHERILYEKLKQQWDLKNIERQALLIPMIIPLNPQEMHAWEQYNESFIHWGIHGEALGPDSLAIREVPVLIQECNITELIRDILSDLIVHQKSFSAENLLEEFLGNLACRAAVHARRKLTIPEMDAILRQMEMTKHAGQCNHGRPTCISFSLKELDRLFLRGK